MGKGKVVLAKVDVSLTDAGVAKTRNYATQTAIKAALVVTNNLCYEHLFTVQFDLSIILLVKAYTKRNEILYLFVIFRSF